MPHRNPETPAVLVNGAAQNTVSPLDRGLQYGDGLFETMAIVNGSTRHWALHMRRLREGCLRLGLPFPEQKLVTEARQLCHGRERAVLKVILTRGPTGRGYRPPAECRATRIVGAYPWPDYPSENGSEGVTIRICSTRLGLNPALAGLKHLNRLEQVLARSEWTDPDIAEGLMLDTAEHVIAGTMSNLFVVKNRGLITPDLSLSGIVGVTRGRLLSIASQLGIRSEIRSVSVDDIYAAQELFLCNSLIEIWPVRRIETDASVCYPLGEVTKRLMDESLEET